MEIFYVIILGMIIAAAGSILPSFLNLTIIKFSVKFGKKAAIYLIFGYATVIIFQSLIGAYLSSILMKNSDYIALIQKIGTVIVILLSIYFFRLHFVKKNRKEEKKIKKTRAYAYGLTISSLIAFAIPLHFSVVSVLIATEVFIYSFVDSLYFAIGCAMGSLLLYGSYTFLAKKIEKRVKNLATKMNFILGCLIGGTGLVNLFYLL